MKLILAYKNFAAANPNISHIGLGVSALNTCKVLRDLGVNVDVWPIVNPEDLVNRLKCDSSVTHVVVSAPWIPTATWSSIINSFTNVEFVVNCHSNVGFLQADPRGVKLFLECAQLQQGSINFHVAGNSVAFTDWVQKTYSVPCLTLPNLYWLTGHTRLHRDIFHFGHSTLRIGAFGAIRPLKNLQTAAAAALALATETRTPIEFWISGGRAEGGGKTVLNAVFEMFHGIPGAKIVENNWQGWPSFRQTLRHMHICFQMSYTESFNMVTADAAAEGVPSVVSGAVDWVPTHWEAHFDDAVDIARVARTLLTDVNAARDGLRAIEDHNHDSIPSWMKFVGLKQRWHRPARVWQEQGLA